MLLPCCSACDVSTTAVRSAAFKPLADVVNASSQPLLEEAAAIGALASKLAPMVQRAQQLQQEQEHDHPIAAALAAAAAAAAADAPSSRRRTGGKGGKGAAAAGPDSGGSQDVGEGVEQQVRAMMLQAGASLEQLRGLNANLGAGEAQ